MRWASAVSDRTDFDAAFADLISQVRGERGDAPPDLAFVFVSAAFAADAPRLPALLRDALHCRILLGCTAEGVIGGSREVEYQPALALTVAELPGVTLRPFALDAESLPDEDASPQAWHEALGVAPDGAPHFILLVDPFSMPIDALLAGIDYAYPRSITLGGLASAARGPGGNVLLHTTGVRHAGAIGLALEGDLRIDTVVAQGCRPIGRPMRITRCHSNVLMELEGKSPLERVHELAGDLEERDQRLLGQGLFVGIAAGQVLEAAPPEFLIRNLIGVDAERGYFAVGDRLRDGQTVQFHVRDARTSAEDLAALLQGCAVAGGEAATQAALIFACLGRGVHLYGAPNHDTDLMRRHLGPVPIGGFFCAGEIGPVAGATRLHGFTSSIGIFRPGSGTAR